MNITTAKTHFDCTTDGAFGPLIATLCGVPKPELAPRTDDVHAVTCGRCRRQLEREGQYQQGTR